MQIHVAQNGKQLGQFSLEDVNCKLAAGTFSPADLGWHEGAARWVALSGIAGVTIQAAPATPIPPPRAPAPGPDAPPAQSTVGGGALKQAETYKGMAVASWILLGLTALVSVVPVVGFAAWFLAFIVVPVAFILAVVILTRGGKTQGILILVSSLVLLPVFILVAPLASTLILGAAVSEREKTQEKQIMENLHALADAKAKWVRQTRVTDGTWVTVAGLSLYLGGKDIKSIVGETYDPKPVGQEPTATLPATKSLASHGKGAILSASGSSAALGTPSPAEDLDATDDDDAPSPAASPEQV